MNHITDDSINKLYPEAEFIATNPSYNKSLELITFRKRGQPWKPGDFSIENDLVCSDIRRLGAWEPMETEIMRDILSNPNVLGFFVDVGSHVGYYTFLAVSFHRKVVSFDYCPLYEYAFNKTLSKLAKADVKFVHGDLKDTPKLDLPDGPISIIKMDIEGLEPEVVSANMNIFNKKRVSYAIIEMSPHKRGDKAYRDILNSIIKCGYRAVNIGNSSPRVLKDNYGQIDEIISNLKNNILTFNLKKEKEDVINILPPNFDKLPSEQWNCLFIREDLI